MSLVFALLAAIVSLSCFADVIYKTIDKDGRVTYTDMKPSTGRVKEMRMSSYPHAVLAGPYATNTPVSGSATMSANPMTIAAPGIFVPDNGDLIHPASREISLYISPAAQPYARVILDAAVQWNLACGVRFEYTSGEVPARAQSGQTVVVVDYGPGALPGAAATTFAKIAQDGRTLSYAKVIITQTRGDADLYFVALHELGHAMGLPHARERTSVMHRSGNRGYYVSSGIRASLTSTDISGCTQMMPSAS